MQRWILRLHRVGFSATTAVALITTVLSTISFPIIAGHTAASREAFGKSIEISAQSLSWLIPVPTSPSTLGGFLLWKAYDFLCLAYPFWAVMAGAGIVRGDEERGIIAQLLTSGVSRTEYLLKRALGFAVISFVSIFCVGLVTWISSFTTGTPLHPGGVVGASIALFALTWTCFALTIVIAQEFSISRVASGVAGIVLILFFLLSSYGRSSSTASWLNYFSPFGWYYRTRALAPGGVFDIPSVLALLIVGCAATAGAAVLYRYRDDGAATIRRIHANGPERPLHLVASRILRIPTLRGVWTHRLLISIWTAAISCTLILLVDIARGSAAIFATNAALQAYLRGYGGSPAAGLVEVTGFGFMQLLLSIFVITQVSEWSIEDQNGFLELALSQPRHRRAIVMERLTQLLAMVGIISLISLTIAFLDANLVGVHIVPGPYYLSAVILWPFAMTFASIGAALVGSIPRLTVIILAALTVISYFLYDLSPIFRWPDWIANLSMYTLYGTPYRGGIFAGGLFSMCIIIGLGTLIAGKTMRERSVGT
ncbi:MAG: ABC transporter permease subunit [Candidatus Dormibacteria bacterium]